VFKGLPQGDADVLGRVVVINVQVAFAADVQIHEAVARDLLKHMVEKTDACVKIRLTRAVEIEAEFDLGFVGVALDLRVTLCHNANLAHCL
jgi:hypothetical protein